MIAFGGLSWALDGAAAPVAAVLRLQEADGAGGRARPRGDAAGGGHAGARDPLPQRDASPIPARASRCSTGFDLTIPAGSSLAIVGQNGAGKTTLAKLLCRLYDPQEGAIEIDGVDLRDARPRRLALARDRGVPGLHPLRAAAARQRGARAARRTTSSGRRSPEAGAAGPGRPRHGARARLRGRHRSLRRPVAARRAGAGAVRGAAGRGPGAARRAHRAARRARRGRDLRPHPRRHAAHHHDPDLAPLLDRAPRRPHLRARARPGGRARHARRADGARAAATARCSTCRRRASATTARTKE